MVRSGDIETSYLTIARASGMGRAVGGALIFSLPMLMTMEMWWLGFYADRARLALLLIVNLPLLVLLSRHAGFERTVRLRDDVKDALIAYGVAIVVSVIVLGVFNLVGPGMNADEIVGKIAIQTVPASIGALLGRSQLGGACAGSDEATPDANYVSEIFLMAVGALFLGLNVAPTEEMILISYMMSEWHAVALVALSLALMHGFIYAMEFRGEAALPRGTPWWSAFLRFTVVGYATALLISVYVLWTFGRTDGVDLGHIVMAVVVLGFPASIGAAAARLII